MRNFSENHFEKHLETAASEDLSGATILEDISEIAACQRSTK